MLWWKNIIGTMVVVLGLVIFSGGVVWIALISLYYSKLPIPWFIPALVPGILLTITGFLGLFSGNCSPKKPKRSFGVLIAFMFFSAIVALAFVGGGLAIFFLKDDIYQTVDGWSVVVLDTFTKSLKLSSMVDSCNFNGDGLLHNGPIKSGAWLQNNTNVAANVTTTNATTTTIATATIEAITTILISRPNISLGSGNSTIEGSEKCLRIAVKNWLSLNLQAIAIVLLVISAIILASFVAAILVHKWNTRDNEKQEHEEKGMEMPEIRDNDKPYCDSDDDLEQPQPVTPNPLHKRMHDNDPYANNNPQGDVHV